MERAFIVTGFSGLRFASPENDALWPALTP
jgi:hypothetical protein